MKKLLNTLYVINPNSYLSLDGENVVVQQEEGQKRVPLHILERIITFGYTGASPALMGKCAEDGRECRELSTETCSCAGNSTGRRMMPMPA